MGRTRWATRAFYSALGPEGFVRTVRIAEWFQEAAVHASTAGGYPPPRYEAIGASWMVRELEIIVDREIEYDEPITVETWISDIRRFRSNRQYVARNAAEQIVARGRADWLLLEQVNGRVRPRLPDAEMLAAFPVVNAVAVEEGPGLSPLEAETSVFTRSVRATELDRHRHVNHTAYVGWIEDLELPIRHLHLKFEKDAKLGDLIELRVKRTEARTLVEAIRDGDRVMVAGVSVR